MKKHRSRILAAAFAILAMSVLVLWFLRPPQAGGSIIWGVTFSHTFAEHLNLDWRETYIAVLDDLGARNIRVPVYWPEIESEKGIFDFSDYDWMMDEAKKRDANITLVVGQRVPRWPECHVPMWTERLSKDERAKALRGAITEIVERYKKSPALIRWQVENEPFLPYFGKCPPPDAEALDAEIQLVKFLDPSRPVIVTDSGELSIWTAAYKRADIFGTTMYRRVWSNTFSKTFGYITYPLPPKFFWFKTNIMRALHGNKPIIVSELQAEPWGPEFFRIASMTLEERASTMSVEYFKDNITYARAAGFPEVYLWGVEWWYMLKQGEEDASYWNFAKEIIQKDNQ
ncbi:MAG: glycoside hydrolase family 2 TIM barrel-domain containing protein [Patescibacteria group bacterium]